VERQPDDLAAGVLQRRSVFAAAYRKWHTNRAK
jgi:hypothetical protein